MRPALRWLLRVLGLLLSLPLAYLLAALLLGLLPVHTHWAPAPQPGAVPVWLRSNGVHADLVLPLRAPHDWTAQLPPTLLLDSAGESSARWQWLAFGWGDRGFYLNTPTWAELRARTAWVALTGQGPAAMHVELVDRPERFRVVRLDLSPAEYTRLVAFIENDLVRDAKGAPLLIDHPGFGVADRFFEANGRYSLWLTSNDWVRRALAHAGVRTARWAPFDAALFWQANRVSSQ
jgi:uncharacterized protein (TIGR02117 family)